jgi:hypothetical protein
VRRISIGSRYLLSSTCGTVGVCTIYAYVRWYCHRSLTSSVHVSGSSPSRSSRPAHFNRRSQ